MKYSFKITTYKMQWTGFILLLCSSMISCKNDENTKQEINTLPTGKWKITQLKNPQKSIVFDTTRPYFVEHYTKDSITITAEDNSLSGELIVVNKDSFKLETVAVSDVCCNSEAAKLLFSFFYGTLKYKQIEDKLILSSNKTLVTLEKTMK